MTDESNAAFLIKIGQVEPKTDKPEPATKKEDK